MQFQSHESKSESSLDLAPCTSSSRVPGKAMHFVIVGRNVRQWRAAIEYSSVVPMDDGMTTPDSLTHPKSKYTLPTQKILVLFYLLISPSINFQGFPKIHVYGKL